MRACKVVRALLVSSSFAEAHRLVDHRGELVDRFREGGVLCQGSGQLEFDVIYLLVLCADLCERCLEVALGTIR